MYLYFFDIDDTICNTNIIVQDILSNVDSNKLSKAELEEIITTEFNKFGVENLELLNNSTVKMLQHLLQTNPSCVYYITARPSNPFIQGTKTWLKKHNLWLNDEKLIMDTEGIKGKTINNIMQQNPNYKFAFLFDDLQDNHTESAPYKNIISCLP